MLQMPDWRARLRAGLPLCPIAGADPVAVKPRYVDWADPQEPSREIVRRAFVIPEVRQVSEGDDPEYEWTITTAGLKRDNNILEIAGIKVEAYLRNPVVMWVHSYWGYPDGLPIGRTTKLMIEADRIRAWMRWAPTPEAQTIRRLVDGGFLRAASIGWWPLKWERLEDPEGNWLGWRFTESDMLEWSVVPVPADPQALKAALSDPSGRAFRPVLVRMLADARAQGIDVSAVEPLVRGVVPYEETPTLDEDREWDASEVVARLRRWAGGPAKEDIDWAKYRRAFLWYDAEDRENFSAYKAPHHDVDDGALKTHWRGTVASMVVLLGGRGGLDIPDDDRRPAYNHLAKHYRQYEKEPPEFRHVEAQVLRGLAPEVVDAVEQAMLRGEHRMLDAVARLHEPTPTVPRGSVRIVSDGHAHATSIMLPTGTVIPNVTGVSWRTDIRGSDRLAYVTLEMAGVELDAFGLAEVEQRVGAVLNKRNKDLLTEARDRIQQVLDSAEKAEEEDDESSRAQPPADQPVLFVAGAPASPPNLPFDPSTLRELIAEAVRATVTDELADQLKRHFGL